MRDSSDPPFDEDDQRLLAELAPTLGAMLRRSVATPAAAEPTDAEAIPPGTVIVNADLAATSWTPSFRTWLSELPASAPGPDALPPAVYEIAARALDPAEDVVDLPNRVRIRGASGRWSAIEGAPRRSSTRPASGAAGSSSPSSPPGAPPGLPPRRPGAGDGGYAAPAGSTVRGRRFTARGASATPAPAS